MWLLRAVITAKEQVSVMRLSAFRFKVEVVDLEFWQQFREMHGLKTASPSASSMDLGIHGVHYAGEPTHSSRQRANRAVRRGFAQG